MKKIYKIFSLLLCFAILFSSTMIANASEVDENKEAYDAFYEIVSAAFAEKGKELIIEYDENHTYTQQDIDAMLEFLENDEVTIEIVDNDSEGNISRLMPSTFEGSKSVIIESGVAVARFNLEFSGVLDLQGNNIMSVDSLKMVYFAGINYSSHSLTLEWFRNTNTSNTSCFVVLINGYVLFSWSLLGLNYSVNEPVSEMVIIDALDYI